jgi:hypothetical protein
LGVRNPSEWGQPVEVDPVDRRGEAAILDRVAVAIITSDKTIKTSDTFLSTAKKNMERMSNFIIYSDSITQYDTIDGLPETVDTRPLVKPCCGSDKHLGTTLALSQYKLEKTLADFYSMFPEALFFIYSDHDVWWNPSVIASQLGPLMASTKKQDYIVAGAGGYPAWPRHLFCGCGAIVSSGMMRYISQEKTVQAARNALISGRKWVPGKKAGALYNNDHLLLTLFESAPEKVSYHASDKQYLFNAWWSSLKTIMRTIANLLEDHTTCSKGLLEDDDSNLLAECAQSVLKRGIMAIHHITVEDHNILMELNAKPDPTFPDGVCECTMPDLFGQMLPYFMRYGASPWNRNLEEWGMYHLHDSLPCGL